MVGEAQVAPCKHRGEIQIQNIKLGNSMDFHRTFSFQNESQPGLFCIT